MRTTQGWKICPYGSFHSFKLGFGCSTRLVQVDHEIQCCLNHGWSYGFTFDKVNPTIMNPFTHMWLVIHASQLFFNAFLEYLKVAKIAMVHVLSFVEDERCFNSIAFLKNKVRNRLNNHFRLVVSMYAHKFFTFHNFPYDDTYEMWSNV